MAGAGAYAVRLLRPPEITVPDVHLSPVHLVSGDERFLVDREVQRLVDAALPGVQPAAFNATTVRCSEGQGQMGLGEARTPPMMASHRLVVIRDVDQAKAAFFEALEDYLASPSPTTWLILTGGLLPAGGGKGSRNWRTRIANRVGKVGTVTTFASRDSDPVRFCVVYAGELGHRLDRDDARRLVDLVGPVLERLARELEKASLAVPEGAPLDGDLFASLCASVAEQAAWDMADAIVAARPSRALGQLHRLLAQGEAPQMLRGAIAFQLRRALKVADKIAAGAPESDVRKAAGRMPGFAYTRLRRALDEHPLDPPTVLRELAEANHAMNRGGAGDARVLEGLVLRIASRGAA